MVGAKLTSPGRPASFWRTECHPKRFDDAFRDFHAFFKHVTGIAWDDRFEGLPQDENKFKYHPPLLGRPVGALPLGKNPPGFPKPRDDLFGDGDDGDTPDVVGLEEGLVYDTDSEVGDKYSSGSGTPNSNRPSKSSASSTSSKSSGSPRSVISIYNSG